MSNFLPFTTTSKSFLYGNYAVTDDVPRIINMRAVRYNDILLWLKKDLLCLWHIDDGYYHIDNNYLNIHAYGKDMNEAKEDFFDIFAYEIDEYVKCDIHELAENAIDLRNRFLEFIDGEL